MKRRQICFSIVFLFFSVGFPVYAAFNPLSISDSSSIREDIYYTWLTRSLDDLREEKAIIRKNEAGDYFRVSFVEYEKNLQLSVIQWSKTIFQKKHLALGFYIAIRKQKSPSH